MLLQEDHTATAAYRVAAVRVKNEAKVDSGKSTRNGYGYDWLPAAPLVVPSRQTVAPEKADAVKCVCPTTIRNGSLRLVALSTALAVSLLYSLTCRLLALLLL